MAVFFTEFTFTSFTSLIPTFSMLFQSKCSLTWAVPLFNPFFSIAIQVQGSKFSTRVMWCQWWASVCTSVNSTTHWHLVASTPWWTWADITSFNSTVTVSFRISMWITIITSTIKSIHIILWAFSWITDALVFWAVAAITNINLSENSNFRMVTTWLLEGG